MKNAIALLLGTATLAGVAVPAAAQDAGDFTGPRAEALVGYDITRPGSSEDIDNADDIDQSIDDVTYGARVGYDMQVGQSLVLGLEGEWLESEASTDFDTTGFGNFGVGNISAGRDLYVGARVGTPVTDSTLLYAMGGYTNARFDLLATDNTTDVETDVDLDGWRIGGGLEQQLSDNVFVRGEYRYSNYEEGEVEAPSGLESDRFDVDVDRHQVLVGLGYRF
ncbi:outer membrane protein [Aurantiacibacter gilvus]|uniref:Outer membrane beta-barrel protein n=1 Tax=Aurantiacibacter gilvus TaxID=3139141 RepID=A0ABU9IDZ1_9SPHN